jgi:hypothetical protein
MKWGIYARAGQIANTPSSQEITAYYDSRGFTPICDSVASTTTVYNSTYNTINNAYTNSSPIYSNSSLTIPASAGYYADSYASLYYYWNGSSWTSTGACER